MPRNFSGDYYIFCAPKDNPDTNSYIKIIDPDCPFAGVVFVINYIKVRRKYLGLFGPYQLKFDYNIIEPPNNAVMDVTGNNFKTLVGDIILDIWDKYYA